MEIKVTPEQLEQVAKRISDMQRRSQELQQHLNQSMYSIQTVWQGATSQHFYGEYVRSTKLMENYIHNLQGTENKLRQIAQKFRQADEEHKGEQKKEKLQEPHKKEKEKSWLDKAWTETKEFLGINDAIRAITGKDPETGKTLSTKDRWIAAGWTAINFIPVGKVVGLLGKGIKFAGKFVGKAVIKATKPIAEGVTMITSKAKSFVQKLGDALHRGKTVVKTAFLEADKKVQAAIKTLMEYKWIPGTGKAYAIPGGGSVRDAGSLKDAYQFMKDTGEKVKNWIGGKGTPKADLDKIRETAPDYYKELIDKYGDKGRYFARSPEEYESLAKDPAKNFKINEKSKIERLAGLELEARGDLPGPIVRDTNPAGAEFIDATGVKWDVKGWYSKFAPKGYTLEKAIADIEESLSKGENVIIDSSKMFPEHIDEVREAVKEFGLSDKLLWWP
nr:WXG100 family type VII secretion target [Bacillus cereus group sp. BfR-BA-01380]